MCISWTIKCLIHTKFSNDTDNYLICVLVIIAVYKVSELASAALKVVNFMKLDPAIVHYTSHTVSVQWNT